MEVRFAAYGDIDLLIRLRLDFFDDDPVMTVTDEKRAIITTQLRDYYTKHLNKDFFAALAVVDGNVAAVSFLLIHEKPANYRFPTGIIGEILNVFTYIEYRFNGFATATLKALIEKAREENASVVELSATKAGRPVYEKLGFVDVLHTHSTEMVLSLL